MTDQAEQAIRQEQQVGVKEVKLGTTGEALKGYLPVLERQLENPQYAKEEGSRWRAVSTGHQNPDQYYDLGEDGIVKGEDLKIMPFENMPNSVDGTARKGLYNAFVAVETSVKNANQANPESYPVNWLFAEFDSVVAKVSTMSDPVLINLAVENLIQKVETGGRSVSELAETLGPKEALAEAIRIQIGLRANKLDLVRNGMSKFQDFLKKNEGGSGGEKARPAEASVAMTEEERKAALQGMIGFGFGIPAAGGDYIIDNPLLFNSKLKALKKELEVTTDSAEQDQIRRQIQAMESLKTPVAPEEETEEEPKVVPPENGIYEAQLASEYAQVGDASKLGNMSVLASDHGINLSGEKLEVTSATIVNRDVFDTQLATYESQMGTFTGDERERRNLVAKIGLMREIRQRVDGVNPTAPEGEPDQSKEVLKQQALDQLRVLAEIKSFEWDALTPEQKVVMLRSADNSRKVLTRVEYELGVPGLDEVVKEKGVKEAEVKRDLGSTDESKKKAKENWVSRMTTAESARQVLFAEAERTMPENLRSVRELYVVGAWDRVLLDKLETTNSNKYAELKTALEAQYPDGTPAERAESAKKLEALHMQISAMMSEERKLSPSDRLKDADREDWVVVAAVVKRVWADRVEFTSPVSVEDGISELTTLQAKPQAELTDADKQRMRELQAWEIKQKSDDFDKEIQKQMEAKHGEGIWKEQFFAPHLSHVIRSSYPEWTETDVTQMVDKIKAGLANVEANVIDRMRQQQEILNNREVEERVNRNMASALMGNAQAQEQVAQDSGMGESWKEIMTDQAKIFGTAVSIVGGGFAAYGLVNLWWYKILADAALQGMKEALSEGGIPIK